MNNPQIVVAVILDSAVGLHQGGQVSAPVFRRISQQVLEYLHVPHDLPLAPQHQLLLAKMKDKDLEEGTPDHPGEPLETAEVNGNLSDAGEDAECGAGAHARGLPEAKEMSSKPQCASWRLRGSGSQQFRRKLQTQDRRHRLNCHPAEPWCSTSSRVESKSRRS